MKLLRRSCLREVLQRSGGAVPGITGITLSRVSGHATTSAAGGIARRRRPHDAGDLADAPSLFSS